MGLDCGVAVEGDCGLGVCVVEAVEEEVDGEDSVEREEEEEEREWFCVFSLHCGDREGTTAGNRLLIPHRLRSKRRNLSEEEFVSD